MTSSDFEKRDATHVRAQYIQRISIRMLVQFNKQGGSVYKGQPFQSRPQRTQLFGTPNIRPDCMTEQPNFTMKVRGSNYYRVHQSTLSDRMGWASVGHNACSHRLTQMNADARSVCGS